MAPDTSTTESRKNPPRHISSSVSLPEVIRTVDEACVRLMADSGITMIPRPAAMVNGNSPVWCDEPRNFRISMVRRRFSSAATLRRMMTLSATNSSIP